MMWIAGIFNDTYGLSDVIHQEDGQGVKSLGCVHHSLQCQAVKSRAFTRMPRVRILFIAFEKIRKDMPILLKSLR